MADDPADDTLDDRLDDAFDQMTAALDPPMAVVTVADGDERAGCLVGFHCQSGIDPLRYCVFISKANRTYEVLQRCPAVAVHFLSAGDGDLAELFGAETGDDVDKFARTPFDLHPAGPPLLRQVRHRIVGERVGLLDDGGDHVCVTIDVIAASADGPLDPFRLDRAEDLRPGHRADERRSG
jgi:flavin reductase (DIM6/NTAB) family NADH-FMN oxidoreductase RutF